MKDIYLSQICSIEDVYVSAECIVHFNFLNVDNFINTLRSSEYKEQFTFKETYFYHPDLINKDLWLRIRQSADKSYTTSLQYVEEQSPNIICTRYSGEQFVEDELQTHNISLKDIQLSKEKVTLSINRIRILHKQAEIYIDLRRRQ